MEYLITEYDCATGETRVREMTEQERADYELVANQKQSWQDQ